MIYIPKIYFLGGFPVYSPSLYTKLNKL